MLDAGSVVQASYANDVAANAIAEGDGVTVFAQLVCRACAHPKPPVHRVEVLLSCLVRILTVVPGCVGKLIATDVLPQLVSITAVGSGGSGDGPYTLTSAECSGWLIATAVGASDEAALTVVNCDGVPAMISAIGSPSTALTEYSLHTLQVGCVGSTYRILVVLVWYIQSLSSAYGFGS